MGKKMTLTRDEFRFQVFARDNNKCVICNNPAKDAHHIIERRLWPDGGYYIDNGASLCAKCHLLAESTQLSCQDIRKAAKIDTVMLPPHLYKDLVYDKWGNIIHINGTRYPGELFEDLSVKKALQPVIHLFQPYIKYPRTYHIPQSLGKTKDDRVLDNLSHFLGKEIVITEKMDGENTTIYSNGYCHARSVDSKNNIHRSWVCSLARRIGLDLHQGWRVCGENLWAKHSILYDNLDDYFLVFSIWNNLNECISWNDTIEICQLLDLQTVPEIYTGQLNAEEEIYKFCKEAEKHSDTHEGFVIRIADKFHYSQFRNNVAKWVRSNHVQTSHHWQREVLTRNRKK